MSINGGCPLYNYDFSVRVSPYSSLGFAGMGDEVVREKPLTQALPPPTSGGKGEGLTKPAKWTTTPGSSRHHRKPSWLMISEI